MEWRGYGSRPRGARRPRMIQRPNGGGQVRPVSSFSARNPAVQRGLLTGIDRTLVKTYTGKSAFTGEVPEWPNGPDSKSGVGVSLPWVRIPPSPPIMTRLLARFCFLPTFRLRLDTSSLSISRCQRVICRQWNYACRNSQAPPWYSPMTRSSAPSAFRSANAGLE